MFARLEYQVSYSLRLVQHQGSSSPWDLLEYLEYFVNLGIARKQWFAGAHFCKDSPHRPYVYARGVLPSAEQNLGSSVPQRNNLDETCLVLAQYSEK